MKLFQISFQIIFQRRKSELKFKMWQETHTYSKKESETLQSRYKWEIPFSGIPIRTKMATESRYGIIFTFRKKFWLAE